MGVTKHQQWRERITSRRLAAAFGMEETMPNLLMKQRLRWLGHVARMPKQLLFGELEKKRASHGTKRRWRNIAVTVIKAVGNDDSLCVCVCVCVCACVRARIHSCVCTCMCHCYFLPYLLNGRHSYHYFYVWKDAVSIRGRLLFEGRVHTCYVVRMRRTWQAKASGRSVLF